jgi:hypothetical protein
MFLFLNLTLWDVLFQKQNVRQKGYAECEFPTEILSRIATDFVLAEECEDKDSYHDRFHSD